MGGGGSDGESSKSMEGLKCQICDQDGHPALDCPLFCPQCEEPGCRSTMKVLTSRTAANPGRKFLKCKAAGCKGFKWVGPKTDAGSTSSASSSSSKCYHCGGEGHWKKYCPWIDQDNTRGPNIKPVGVQSLTDESQLSDNVKITIEASVSDICKMFSRNVSFERK